MSEQLVARWMKVLVAAGVFFRCWCYGVNRSLWLDELFVWNELGPREPTTFEYWLHVITPMKTQLAAPGFVLLTQVVRALLGEGEMALRLVPFIAGNLSLFVAVRLFRRVLSPVPALMAVAVVACSPIGIYYSVDLKPYSADLLFALVLLDLAVPRLDAPAPRIDLMLWGVGLIAVFVSLPSILVLAGIGAAFVLSDLKQLTSRRVVVNALLAVSWLALFVRQVRLVMPETPEKNWLHQYWVGVHAFPPEGGGVPGFFIWAGGALVRALSTPVGFGGRWEDVSLSTRAAAVLGVVGVVVLVRQYGRRALLFLSPVVLTLVAAGLDRYPFQGRVICFLVPSLTLCVALGLERLGAFFPSRPRLLAVLSGLLVVETAAMSLYHLYAPFYREESRPVLEWAKANSARGDVFFMTNEARLAWRYYAPRLGITDVLPLDARVDEHETEAIVDEMISRISPRPRAFLFITHYYAPNDTRSAMLDEFAKRGGRVLRRSEAPSASVLELDFSQLSR